MKKRAKIYLSKVKHKGMKYVDGENNTVSPTNSPIRDSPSSSNVPSNEPVRVVEHGFAGSLLTGDFSDYHVNQNLRFSFFYLTQYSLIG